MKLSHSGQFGDLIYALPTIKALGGAPLVLFPALVTAYSMTRENAALVQPLLACQPYLYGVEWRPESVGLNLDHWRYHYNGDLNLADMMASWLGVPHSPRLEPWLEVEGRPVAEVVFCRSLRYRNPEAPWQQIWTAYHDKAVFVGHEEEHEDFCREIGPVAYHKTKDFLALAQVLAGARLVCCNQSAPRAVAEGLKVPVLVEVGTPGNTHFERPNAWYAHGGPLESLPF